jgi:hypothetical protein
MNAGTKQRKITEQSKNIIMEGITLTLESVLDRHFDENHVDNNLRQGAIERKAYIAKGYHFKQGHYNGVEPLFDKYTPIKIASKKYVTTEVSTHPQIEGKHTVYTHNKTKELSPETTVKNYQQGVEVLRNLNFNDPKDTLLSQPLDIPPAGKSGATLITPQKTILSETSGLNIGEPSIKNISNEHSDTLLMEGNEKIIKTENQEQERFQSTPVDVVRIPPNIIYNEVPFI